MSSDTADSRASGAVSEVGLTTSAANIIQEDCASANTKISITEGHSTYWQRIWTKSTYIKNPLVADLGLSSLAVGTLQWHQFGSKNHHTQCPIHCWCRSQLCLHTECFLPQVVADQLHTELNMWQLDENYLYVKWITIILSGRYTFTTDTSITRMKTVMGCNWTTGTCQ